MATKNTPYFLKDGSYKLPSDTAPIKFDQWKTDVSSHLLSSIIGSLENSAKDLTTSLKEVAHGAAYTYNIGFYCNHEIIGNLLQVVVQLALFGSGTQVSVGTSPPSEEEQRLLGWKYDAEVTSAPMVANAGCQARASTATSPSRPRRSNQKVDCGRVRIGGGYHIVGLAEQAEYQVEISPERQNDGECENGIYEEACHAFAHGQVPDGMGADRYSVGSYQSHTYASGLMYRVLRPAQHDVELENDIATKSRSSSPHRVVEDTAEWARDGIVRSGSRGNLGTIGEVQQGRLRPLHRPSQAKNSLNTLQKKLARPRSAPHLQHMKSAGTLSGLRPRSANRSRSQAGNFKTKLKK